MGLLAVAVVVAILVVGGMLLSGGEPQRVADPSAPPSSAQATRRPSRHARPRPANPTASAHLTQTATPTPTISVRSPPQPSVTACPPGLPPGLKKKQCGRHP